MTRQSALAGHGTTRLSLSFETHKRPRLRERSRDRAERAAGAGRTATLDALAPYAHAVFDHYQIHQPTRSDHSHDYQSD